MNALESASKKRSMRPLDLSQRAPRSCREELGGIAFLPRAIDKARASLPGGALGDYINELDDTIPTMSGLFYRRMGVTHEEFAHVVAGAADEAEVLAWIRARVDDERIAKWHRQLFRVRLTDVRREDWSRVVGYYPTAASAQAQTLMIDIIDQDDVEMFETKQSAD